MRTVKIKFLPTIAQEDLMILINKHYIRTSNEIVAGMVKAEKPLKLTSEDMDAPMSSAVKTNRFEMPKVSIENQRNWERFQS